MERRFWKGGEEKKRKDSRENRVRSLVKILTFQKESVLVMESGLTMTNDVRL